MRIKVTLVSIMLLLCTAASAQIYEEDYNIDPNKSPYNTKLTTFYGVMAGVYAPIMSDKDSVIEVDNCAGFNMGVMYGLNFGSVELVPELWYQHSKSDIRHTGDKSSGKLVSNNIEMPILAALKFGVIRINVGPSLSLMSSSKIEMGNDEPKEFGRFKSTVGYLVGLSATLFDHLIIDARYSGRFVTTENAWFSDGESHNYRFYSYGVNVGYRF